LLKTKKCDNLLHHHKTDIINIINLKEYKKEEEIKIKRELELFEKLTYFWVFRKASFELFKVQGSVLVKRRKISKRKRR